MEIQSETAGVHVEKVRLSNRRQVTIPKQMALTVGLRPGQEYVLANEDGRLVLYPDKQTLTDYYGGIAAGLYGQSDEEIEAYVRDSRGEWEPVPGGANSVQRKAP